MCFRCTAWFGTYIFWSVCYKKSRRCSLPWIVFIIFFLFCELLRYPLLSFPIWNTILLTIIIMLSITSHHLIIEQLKKKLLSFDPIWHFVQSPHPLIPLWSKINEIIFKFYCLGLYIKFRSFQCILDINLLSTIWFINVIFHYIGCLFALLTISLVVVLYNLM